MSVSNDFEQGELRQVTALTQTLTNEGVWFVYRGSQKEELPHLSAGDFIVPIDQVMLKSQWGTQSTWRCFTKHGITKVRSIDLELNSEPFIGTAVQPPKKVCSGRITL